MITCAQITIRDETDNVVVAAVAPVSPTENDLWLDISVTPNLLKRWNGTAWVQVGAEPVGNELIVGTQTTITGTWTGVAGFAELRDGQQITYWLPYNGNGSATLALTLSDGSVTEAIPCYYGGLTRLQTHYSAGSILHLTYRENATIYTTTVANGTYGGLCLYEPSYNFGSANWSDCYIRISGTDDSYNKPYLLVQYSGSTAQG